MKPRVNFTNILQSDFERSDPISAKRQSTDDCFTRSFYAQLLCAHIPKAQKDFCGINPWGQFHQPIAAKRRGLMPLCFSNKNVPKKTITINYKLRQTLTLYRKIGVNLVMKKLLREC